MKLIYCIPHLYNAGGMERVLTEKVNYLAAKGYEVTVVTTELTPSGCRDAYFRLSDKVRVMPLRIDFDADYRLPLITKFLCHCRKMRLYRRKLEHLLMEEKADVCISLCGKEIAFLGALRVPCRKMAEVHFAIDQRTQLLTATHQGRIWRWLGNIRTWQLVRDVRRLDRFIVLTQHDRSDWEKAGCKNVVCIPNPSSICPKTSGEHGLNQVLAVGRLHPQKGFTRLIEAWQLVHRECPEWNLKIVGEGEERPLLEASVRQHGLEQWVSLPGLSDDIASDYLNSALLMQSSRYEGLPLVLIEGMSCGLPCVAFDCPKGPKELIVNGENGLLIPEGDTKALATAAIRLLKETDTRKRMGLCAYRYAQQHFALEPIMQQWITLFNAV